MLGIHAVVGALRRQTEPGARLLQRRHRLVHAELRVGGVEARDSLVAADPAAEVHEQLADPAGDLGAEHDLLVGREGAGGADTAIDHLLRGRHEPDRAGRLALGLGGRGRRRRRDSAGIRA